MAVQAPAKASRKVQVMVRLPEDLVKELDHLGVDLDLYRSEMIELLLRESLDTRKRQQSLKFDRVT